MLGDFFRRSRNRNQRVSYKQKAEVESLASSGGQGKYMKYVNLPWLPLEVGLSVSKFSFFLLKKLFCSKLLKSEEITISAESQFPLKMRVLKNRFGRS